MGSSTDSENSEERRRSSKKSHKKTKKRYRNKSDDDERGYKKFKRKREKKKDRKRDDRSDGEPSPLATPEAPVVIPEPPQASQDSETDSYGPALPPHLLPKERNIGPQLPSDIVPKEESDEELVGPTIGPLPGVSNPQLDQRALEIKLGHTSETPDATGGRESWMTELPKVKGVTDLGLTARQFRTRERPDFSDRSEWTDTPADKERKKHTPKVVDPKEEEERERERRLLAARDAEQEKVAKEHNKKKPREKSLIDLHQEEVKKARKEGKSDEPQGRRPFDRNVDLQANRFDEAQKKAIVKKAQLLDSRFSSGASKYL